MIRKLLAGALVALTCPLLSSCAHTWVGGFGKGYIRICGNAHADGEDHMALALAKGCMNPYAQRSSYAGTDNCTIFSCQTYILEERR